MMFTFTLLLFSLSATLIVASSSGDPDEFLTTPQLIVSRGYNAETHYVTTSDGYILGVHRIINPNFKGQLKPVILNHGLMSSSIDFLINSPGGSIDEDTKVVGNNLGFELAKRGYDVWLSNSRGNVYSQNHTHLDPKSREFWAFSYDEMIANDLPATIDYVLSVTKTQTVAYVGHSQGTTIMFGLLATHPKYNDVIKPFIALAPVSTVAFATSIIRALAYNDGLVDFVKWKGGSFLPDQMVQYFSEKACSVAKPDVQDICASIMFIVAGGFDSPQLNLTRIPVYLAHAPAGTSSQNIVHWAQAIKFGRFAKMDYGIIENLVRYESVIPPEYEVEKITNKNIALMWSKNDGLGDPLDVGLLKKRLKVALLDDYLVADDQWNHLDFIWGMEAAKYVNQHVLDLMSSHA